MSTTPISEYAPVQNSSTSATQSSSSTTGSVDKDMFLKLMVAQVSNEDPMQPTDDSQWLSQMAQFSTVEQLTNMAKDSNMSGAVALIGRTVSYPSSTGSGTVQGIVQSVQSGSTGATLTIDGVTGIDPGTLTDVQ